MTKSTKRKRSKSQGARGRIVLFEVMLRGAAIKYAEVAKLDPSLEAAGQPVGHLPLRALVSGRYAPPQVR